MDEGLVARTIEHKMRLKGKSEILTEDMITKLSSYIPPVRLMGSWEILFCINTDGVSLRTFFDKVKNRNPTVILIQDTNKNIFGAFLTEAWHPSGRFYGTGESFIFSFKVE